MHTTPFTPLVRPWLPPGLSGWGVRMCKRQSPTMTRSTPTCSRLVDTARPCAVLQFECWALDTGRPVLCQMYASFSTIPGPRTARKRQDGAERREERVPGRSARRGVRHGVDAAGRPTAADFLRYCTTDPQRGLVLPHGRSLRVPQSRCCRTRRTPTKSCGSETPWATGRRPSAFCRSMTRAPLCVPLPS